MIGETAWNIAAQTIHDHTGQTLSLSHRTIFVCEKKAFEADDFLSQLGYLARQCIVLSGEQFNLCLKVGEPLLLPLTTLERCNSKT